MMDRRGFFGFIAGAIALVIVPFRKKRMVFDLTPAPGGYYKPGDIVVFTYSWPDPSPSYRILSIDGNTVTVEET